MLVVLSSCCPSRLRRGRAASSPLTPRAADSSHPSPTIVGDPELGRRFMCSRPQGTWDGQSSTTLPHLAVVPMRPSREVPEPPRPPTPMQSPHLPVAGAKVHAFPHSAQHLMCKEPHHTHTTLTRCGLRCGARRLQTSTAALAISSFLSLPICRLDPGGDHFRPFLAARGLAQRTCAV